MPTRSPRGSRLPPGCPTEVELAWCRQERPDLDAALTAAKFRDYWLGVPGQRGCKLDWPATWRNFVRSERPVRLHSTGPPRALSAAERNAAVVAQLTGRAPPTAPYEVIDVFATERTARPLGR